MVASRMDVGSNEPSLTDVFRPFSVSNPLRGCNSDLAHYSNTPILHHSAGRFEDEDENEAPCEAGSWWRGVPGVETPG
jgi:hypothetical protein